MAHDFVRSRRLEGWRLIALSYKLTKDLLRGEETEAIDEISCNKHQASSGRLIKVRGLLLRVPAEDSQSKPMLGM